MFDSRLCDRWNPPETSESGALLTEMADSGRAENQAAARRLTAVWRLFELRRAQRGEQADWAVDTWAAVGAEVSAALRISPGRAGSYMSYGLAMRRLPAVAAAFRAGDISFDTYRTIVYRTELITDDAAMAEVDRLLAERAARWPSMTHGKLITEIDRIIHAHDRDAVRRARERKRDRDVTVWDRGDGTTELSGRLFTTDAALFNKRLDALAATVCPEDPRTVAQRRADAVGALAAGAERLRCQCGRSDCPATAATPTGVVIHVVANQSALEGGDDSPGYLFGANALIPAELLRELATASRQQSLLPAGTPVEPRYKPSSALADFVRARDLTCRAPGCDRPATDCDIDHTVPYADGGATHASNLKCLCRFHHLIKTFWGWRDRQLQDGTVIWSLPDGQTYVTTPGSALLFPTLMAPTGLPLRRPTCDRSGDGARTTMMPKRKTTRAQNRAHSVEAERSENRRYRHERDTVSGAIVSPGVTPCRGDDPPF